MRERLTSYQSEDPSPTVTTHRMKEEKGEIVGDKMGASNKANKKTLALLLKIPPVPHHRIHGQQHSSTETLTEDKVLRC